MDALGKYILSVAAAAILLGILQSLLGKKSGTAVLLQLIGGLFLAFTVISPVARVDLDLLFEMPFAVTADGNAIAAQGQALSRDQLESIIKEQCESYILDKALCFQADLEVEVTLSRDEMPVPSAVRLLGSVSPYAKQALQQWLQDEMGIPKENQLWIGS